jgi:hypothetical protein
MVLALRAVLTERSALLTLKEDTRLQSTFATEADVYSCAWIAQFTRYRPLGVKARLKHLLPLKSYAIPRPCHASSMVTAATEATELSIRATGKAVTGHLMARNTGVLQKRAVSNGRDLRVSL